MLLALYIILHEKPGEKYKNEKSTPLRLKRACATKIKPAKNLVTERVKRVAVQMVLSHAFHRRNHAIEEDHAKAEEAPRHRVMKVMIMDGREEQGEEKNG